jgi:hypothetical protein
MFIVFASKRRRRLLMSKKDKYCQLPFHKLLLGQFLSFIDGKHFVDRCSKHIWISDIC